VEQNIMTSSNDGLLLLNNLGVRLFEKGRLEEAKQSFREAFRAVLALGKTPLKADDSMLEQGCAIRGWSSPMQRIDDDTVFVYSRLIVLHPKFDFRQKELYSICIAYNLALAYHMLAIKSTNLQSWGYRQACALYEQAMTTLEGLLVRDQQQGQTAQLSDLKVVILNNAGHIYYTDRVNYGAATQCFVAVCAVVNHSEKSGEPTELVADEVDRMVSNVLMRYSIAAPMA